MENLKYLKRGQVDSAGHVNDITAADTITIGIVGNRISVMVKLNHYKDAESKLASKSPSIDRVRPEHLFEAELGSSLIDFHNMIMESLAKKHKVDIVNVEAELELKPSRQLMEERKIASAKKQKADDLARIEAGKKLPVNSKK